MNYSCVELLLPADCVADCSASGPVDDAVAYWLTVESIRSQFAPVSLLDSARILYGYGAWEAHELTDLETNLARLLWLACGDVRDAGEGYAAEQEARPDGALWACLEGAGYDSELATLENAN